MSGEKNQKYDVKQLQMQNDKGGPFENDLEEIPYYMRERVAYLIEQKVEKRVQAHMTQFREEVMRELEDQRLQNQSHIAHYMQPQHYNKGHPNAGYYGGAGYGRGGYPGYGANYGGQGMFPYGGGGYGGGHGPWTAGYGPARRMSKSPVRKSLINAGYTDEDYQKGYRRTDDQDTDYQVTKDRKSIFQGFSPSGYRKSKANVQSQKWDTYANLKGDRYEEEEKWERSERRQAYDQNLRNMRGGNRALGHENAQAPQAVQRRGTLNQFQTQTSLGGGAVNKQPIYGNQAQFQTQTTQKQGGLGGAVNNQPRLTQQQNKLYSQTIQ